MLCKHPYCKRPTGQIVALSKVNREARLAVVPFPCGQCLHCRINKSRIWATRLKMERDLHKESIFVTLTYNDESIPIERGAYSLNPDHFTKFLKKFRKQISNRKIRYFGVGEYGKITSRPHYHLVIFNSKMGDDSIVKDCWKEKGEEMGFTDCLDITNGLINYIAGYVVDKLVERGQIDFRVHKPFMRSSRGKTNSICAKYKGGIGAGYAYYVGYQIRQNEWIEHEDITKMVYGSKQLPIGRYLSEIIAYESGVPEEFWEIKNDEYYDELLDEINAQVGRDYEVPKKNPYKKEGKAIPYYDAIRARFKQQRVVQEARDKIYRSRNKL